MRIHLLKKIRAFVSLTKPTIVFSYVLTGAVTLVLEGSISYTSFKFWLILFAITLTGASANAFNQYFEREIDAKMERTRQKRPLPQQQLTPKEACAFSIISGLLAIVTLFLSSNLLSSLLSLGTILFYSFYYTLWLKARTPYNIVIGGAAGASAPLIAWAAVTGSLSLTPWLLFLIIFLWTPPHFWALALNLKDQYAKVGLPMLPLVKGETRTKNEIWGYSLILVPLTLGLYWTTNLSFIYLLVSFVLGFFWLFFAWKVKRAKVQKTAYQFFGYSVFYLIGLFTAMMF